MTLQKGAGRAQWFLKSASTFSWRRVTSILAKPLFNLILPSSVLSFLCINFSGARLIGNDFISKTGGEPGAVAGDATCPSQPAGPGDRPREKMTMQRSLTQVRSGLAQAVGFTMAVVVGVQHRLTGQRKDRGATAVEYGLLVGLIAIVIIVAVSALGGRLQAIFASLAKQLGG